MSAPQITPDVAKKVLAVDDVNLLKKANAGKPLTKAERGRLENVAATPATDVYDSIEAAVGALQAQFGAAVNKRLLQKLKKEPGSAKAFRGSRVYLNELIPFLEAKLSNPATSEMPDKYLLECEKLKEQIEGIRFENARARGAYWPRPEVDAWMIDRQARIKEILRKVLKNELPPKLVGLTAAEISNKMDEPIHSIVELIRQ